MYKSTSRFLKSLDRSRLRPSPPEEVNVFERVRLKQAAKYEANHKANHKRAVKTGIGQDKRRYTEPDNTVETRR